MTFGNSVFINCPFDDEFKPLLNPLLFCILQLGLEPLVSQTDSSADIRINQIKKRIRSAQFSIHDLSRCVPPKPGELPRHNMPFELGMDIGCLAFGIADLKKKKILIVDSEPHRYVKYLSDIAGQDIKVHGNDPLDYIKVVRDWLANLVKKNKFPTAAQIWTWYNLFVETGIRPKYTDHEIRTIDLQNYLREVKAWIKKQAIE